jgi:hypothetical protein
VASGAEGTSASAATITAGSGDSGAPCMITKVATGSRAITARAVAANR